MRPGERVKLAREERGLNLTELAHACDISVATLHDIESGKTKRPRGDTLVAIARELRVSEKWLITGRGDKQMVVPSVQELELLADFRALDGTQKEVVAEMIHRLAFSERAATPPTLPNPQNPEGKGRH